MTQFPRRDAGATFSARLLLHALQGHEPRTLLEAPSRHSADNDDDDDDDARGDRLNTVHADTLGLRVRAAIAEDVADVVLADGSALPMATAVRRLALKEERGVYGPLRGPIEAARGRARDVVAERALVKDAEAAAGVIDDVAVDRAADVAALRAFLSESQPLLAPALEVLRSTNNGVGDAAQLARALDRPSPGVCNDTRVVELVRATRESVPGAPLSRLMAPRALLGQLVDDCDRLRVGFGVVASVGAYGAVVAGVGAAYARALAVADGAASGHDDAATHADVDDAVAAHVALVRGLGPGLGLMLQAPPCSRAVGLSRADAESLWRERVATSIVERRVQAAVALALVDGRSQVDPEAPAPEQAAQLRDVARGAGRAACGIDVGHAKVAALMGPLWPTGVELCACDAGLVARAVADSAAAAVFVALREAFDESAPLRRQGLWGAQAALLGQRGAAATAWGRLFSEIA